MKKAPLIARLILGIMFFVFGLNGFLHFIPMPATMPEKVTAMMTGLNATGYFFPFLKGVETLCGFLLLVGAFVPLALIVLAPIVVQIILFHGFLDASGLPMTAFISILMIYLSFFAQPYSSVVKQIFRRSSNT